jgi:hypothetical protein
VKKAANEKSGSPLSGRLWKWLIVLAALCLAAYLVIWYMPHSEEVSWSGTAVEYRMDNMDFAEDHEAVIRGTYTWNRAGKRTFEGDFWIDGLDIDPDGRTKLTLESKKSHYDERVQFYDAAGQPVTTQVYDVLWGVGGQGAVVRLWDEYTRDAKGSHAAFGQGQRFICIGTLSQRDAIILVDTLRQQSKI